MILIPAIDLRGGKVVRLFQGDFSQEKVYGKDPLAYAQLFEREGAKRLHVVDLEGAKEGKPVHQEQILSIAQGVEIPLQVGGGIRRREDVEVYLDGGVSQVILGTKALLSKKFLEDLALDYPDRIIVSVDVKGELVALSGWVELSTINYLDFIQSLRGIPLFAIILTIIERDGTRGGIDLERLVRALEISPHPLILAGGVATKEDLLKIKPLSERGLYGVISGRAIYEGSLNLKDALAILQS